MYQTWSYVWKLSNNWSVLQIRIGDAKRGMEMKKGSSFWLRNKSLARFMSVFLSVSMVLSLLPAQGVEEARSEFLFATTAAQAEENLGENTDPGGGNDPNNTPAGGDDL